jgi:anaerobic selenocysteine-containing dehydrogenase
MIVLVRRAGENKCVHTACEGLHAHRGIRVHAADGALVGRRGNPEPPAGRACICAKGTAELMAPHARHRINCLIWRADREKGVRGYLQWQQIAWEEASGTVVAELKNMEDPRGAYPQATPVQTGAIRLRRSARPPADGGRPGLQTAYLRRKRNGDRRQVPDMRSANHAQGMAGLHGAVRGSRARRSSAPNSGPSILVGAARSAAGRVVVCAKLLRDVSVGMLGCGHRRAVHSGVLMSVRTGCRLEQ